MALADSLWAHYSMDETTGNRVDSSSNKRDLSSDGVVYGVGKIGNAAKFTGDTGMLSIFNQAVNWSSGLTISFWFYLNALTLAIAKINLGSFDDDNYLQINLVSVPGSNSKDSIYVKYPDDSNTIGYSEYSITTKAWHFLVCKISGSNLIAKIDNVEVINTPVSLASASLLNWLQVDHSEAVIGDYNLIDELAIWERATTDIEDASLWNSGNGDAFSSTGGGGGATVIPPIKHLVSPIMSEVNLKW